MKTSTYPANGPRFIPYNEENLDVLRWLVRETFDKTIAADGLVLVEYADRDVDPASLNPKFREAALDALVESGGDRESARWREFTATAKLPPELEALITG